MVETSAGEQPKNSYGSRLLKQLTDAYTGCRYCRYFVIGGTIGVSAVMVLEIMSRLLPDKPVMYAISVALVYICGIIAGYYSHRRVTFNCIHIEEEGLHSLIKFTLIAVIGLVTTTVLAMLLRYGMPLEVITGKYTRAVAFALAALIASIITYYLNARFTFAVSKNSAEQKGGSQGNTPANPNHNERG